MKTRGRKIAIVLLLSLLMLLPSTFVTGRREYEAQIGLVLSAPPLWEETPMPNGFTKLYAELVFDWYYEGEYVGTATQYVTGVIKYEGEIPVVAMLRGYGVYEAAGDLSGTLTYTLGNNWDMVSGEIWAFRMRIVGGTGDFAGIKGTGVDDAYPDFLLYLNFNPWEAT